MKGIWMSLGLVIACVLATPVFAQQVKGDKELQISANMSFTSAQDVQTSGTGSVNLLLGYYLTRQFQVRGGAGLGVMSLPACGQAQAIGSTLTCVAFEGTQMVANPTITAGATFSFSGEGQKTVPYLGADYAVIGMHGGPILSQESGSIVQIFPLRWTNNIRPNGGVKFFVRRNIAFDLNVGWDRDLSDEQAALNTVDMRVGFSYVF